MIWLFLSLLILNSDCLFIDFYFSSLLFFYLNWSWYKFYVELFFLFPWSLLKYVICFQLSNSYDPKFGGFGSAPKFPRPVEIFLTLYESKKLTEEGRENEANRHMKMVCHSLQCMARGGIHDHIGGGFHRYSVDECWHGECLSLHIHFISELKFLSKILWLMSWFIYDLFLKVVLWWFVLRK